MIRLLLSTTERIILCELLLLILLLLDDGTQCIRAIETYCGVNVNACFSPFSWLVLSLFLRLSALVSVGLDS